MFGCKRLQLVVKVPAGALRPTRGSPCHRSNLPHSCLELSLLLLAFRRARRAGQAFDASTGLFYPFWVPSTILEPSAFV